MPFYFRKECPLNSGYLTLQMHSFLMVRAGSSDKPSGRTGAVCFGSASVADLSGVREHADNPAGAP